MGSFFNLDLKPNLTFIMTSDTNVLTILIHFEHFQFEINKILLKKDCLNNFLNKQAEKRLEIWKKILKLQKQECTLWNNFIVLLEKENMI